MQNDFEKFLAWGILVPIGVPLIILGVTTAASGTSPSLEVLFGRPGFLLFSATLNGKPYAELLSHKNAESQPRKFVTSLCNVVLPLLLLGATCVYAWAELNTSLAQSHLLAVCDPHGWC